MNGLFLIHISGLNLLIFSCKISNKLQILESVYVRNEKLQILIRESTRNECIGKCSVIDFSTYCKLALKL